jgi:hypothetical protein
VTEILAKVFQDTDSGRDDSGDVLRRVGDFLHSRGYLQNARHVFSVFRAACGEDAHAAKPA